MANIRGERIATNLLGAVVVPRSDIAADDYWPRTWPEMPPDVAPEDRKQAEVVAVYVVEGHVKFMVRNLMNNKMIETPAEEWRVLKMR